MAMAQRRLRQPTPLSHAERRRLLSQSAREAEVHGRRALGELQEAGCRAGITEEDMAWEVEAFRAGRGGWSSIPMLADGPRE